MTEKPSKEFEPITTQEEFDQRIKARLAREREKWEKESGTTDLKAELEAIKRERRQERVELAVRAELASRGVTDEGRITRTMKLVDLEAIEDGEDLQPAVISQIDSVASDLPELVRPRGAGSGGSSKPVLTPEKPLTRDELEGMSEQEINSRWDQVRAFLAGERA